MVSALHHLTQGQQRAPNCACYTFEMNPSECSDGELLREVVILTGSEREILAKLVVYLGEIEERRLHLVSGYSSMFDFCQKKVEHERG